MGTKNFRELARLEDEYIQYRSRQSWRPTEQDKAEILALAKELPPHMGTPATTTAKETQADHPYVDRGDITIFCRTKASGSPTWAYAGGINAMKRYILQRPIPKATVRKTHAGDGGTYPPIIMYDGQDSQIVEYFKTQPAQRTPGRKGCSPLAPSNG